jgi:radical SAM superfamily enzyme YgiQ (UPF0313 family)
MKTRPGKVAGIARKRVLIVCAYLRCDRAEGVFREFLQPMSPLHVAAFIDRGRYDIRLHYEMYHGRFDTNEAASYDIVFLTGLQKDFDRMRQLAYHFRRAGVPTVAGGNVCSIFPEFARRFFDVVCVGSVEATAAVMSDFERNALRPVYRHQSAQVSPYRLDHRLLRESGIRGDVHFIEASRGCNFKCDFCVIHAERTRHAPYDVGAVMQAIHDSITAAPTLSVQRLYPMVWFLDNNFSNNLQHLRRLCAAMKAEPRVKLWGAMVTQDILRNHQLVELMADAKCFIVFTGIESLDGAFLDAHGKRQNIAGGPGVMTDVEHAARCGMHVIYGYLFDPRLTSIDAFKRELAAILRSDILTYPNYISVITPLAGTRLFWSSAERGELLPGLRLRDMDGETLAYRTTVDSMGALSDFAQVLYRRPTRLAGRLALWAKLFRYLFRFRVTNPIIWYTLYRNAFRANLQARAYSRGRRNYIGGRDVLDPEYARIPDGISDADRRTYFEPIFVTDENGRVADWLSPYAAPQRQTPDRVPREAQAGVQGHLTAAASRAAASA